MSLNYIIEINNLLAVIQTELYFSADIEAAVDKLINVNAIATKASSYKL